MVKLSQTYGLGSPIQNSYPLPIISDRDPTTGDTGFARGQLWVNKTSGTIYSLADVASAAANWVFLGDGIDDFETLTGDSGGAISPTSGNIDLSGGTNITTVGSGSDITFNLDDAITLATSISSPIYTATAADLNINAASGQEVIFQLGDAAGTNTFIIEDSAGVDQFNVNSDGEVTLLTGNLILGAVATQLQMNGGAVTDFIGQVTLVAGTVTIANTNIAANDKIFLQREGVAASTALGVLDISITASTSFTITALQPATPGSTETNDVSIVNYFIVRQN